LHDLTGPALLDFTSPGAYTADFDRMKYMNLGEIKRLVNDDDRGGVNAGVVERCKQGSTVLVALVDPGKENVWVASLGDCVAGE
jgi:pyruvate dehydrogenase phosphatase